MTKADQLARTAVGSNTASPGECMVLLNGSADSDAPRILFAGRGLRGYVSYILCNAKSPVRLSCHGFALGVAHHSWVVSP